MYYCNDIDIDDMLYYQWLRWSKACGFDNLWAHRLLIIWIM